MFHAGDRIKDPVGKAFLHASIGEAGEKAFPAGADGSSEPGDGGVANLIPELYPQ